MAGSNVWCMLVEYYFCGREISRKVGYRFNEMDRFLAKILGKKKSISEFVNFGVNSRFSPVRFEVYASVAKLVFT